MIIKLIISVTNYLSIAKNVAQTNQSIIDLIFFLIYEN